MAMIRSARGPVAVLVLLLGASGCTLPRVVWSQRVWLNGRSFVFTRIDSLADTPGDHRIEFRNGDFIVGGRGPILVNGFEVTADGPEVVLASRHVHLDRGEEVRFEVDMTWTVKPGPSTPLEVPPSPAPPGGPAAEEAARPAPAAAPSGGAGS